MHATQGTPPSSIVVEDMSGPLMYWGPSPRVADAVAPAGCECGVTARPPSALAKLNVKAAA